MTTEKTLTNDEFEHRCRLFLEALVDAKPTTQAAINKIFDEWDMDWRQVLRELRK